jgi:cytoskeleton protein RodZ
MSRDERVQHRLAMTMADDRHVDFGTFLRLAREQRGVSLQQLAITTKISARVLEALERNDPSKLPGGIFSRAFVRAYAREVGLDADVAVANFVSAFPNESGADEMPATTSAVEVESFEQRRRVVRVAVRLVGAFLLLAILTFLYYSRFRPGFLATGPDLVQPPAAGATAQAPALPRSQPPAPEPASSIMPGAAQTDAAREADVSRSPAQTEPAAPTAVPPVPSSQPAATPGAPPGAAASQQAPLVVVLTLTDSCWLSVSVDGARMASRTAGAGERLEFAVQRSITMKVGNAGALSVTLNGKPARALGAAGEVVTTTIPASGYETFLR